MKKDKEWLKEEVKKLQVKEDSESHLTEKEIKDYDEPFWPFPVKIEKVTE